jgi:nucleoside 2-deoxyribosyltransferase
MKNYLTGKRVYLSGSMHSLKDSGVSWREEITPRLEKLGIIVSDPCKKTTLPQNGKDEIGADKEKFKKIILDQNWKKLKEDFWEIVRTDLREVDKCDFVIFCYDPLSPTVGTIHELVVATFEKKVILLKYDKSQLDHFNPWIATFVKEHHFFHDWDDMFMHLKHVDDGVRDTSLWVV